MPGEPLIVDAILFDRDGTLVDSNSTVDAMWIEFAVTLGLDPVEVTTFAHGTPSTATLKRFLPESESFDEWFATLASWESGRFGEVGEVAGAIDVVNSLPASRWAVVTSALREAALLRLGRVGFPAPTVLIGADEVAHGKPSPEGFLAAAVALGVDPRACVVFEDSPAGLEAARAAGATTVVVGTLDAPVTRGLSRIHDWTGVTITTTPDGKLSIVGIPASETPSNQTPSGGSDSAAA
jgi:sugar-phosphatase